MPGQRSKYYGKRAARLTDAEEQAKAKALVRLLPHLLRPSRRRRDPDVGVLGGGQLDSRQSSLYRRDWSPTPAAEAYRDLVFKQWWTTWSGVADAQGRCEVRAFFGKHKVTAGGKEVVVELKRGEPTRQVSLR